MMRSNITHSMPIPLICIAACLNRTSYQALDGGGVLTVLQLPANSVLNSTGGHSAFKATPIKAHEVAIEVRQISQKLSHNQSQPSF